VEFDLDSGSGVAWRADLPGLGNSSPVVWGRRVYVTTAVAAGGSTPLRVGRTGSGEEVEENTEHRWLVLAFDKSTGKKVWETEVGRGLPLTKRHFKATQANSSPATNGEHIVVVFPTAGLACLGSDGAIHWKHELGGLNAGGFNDPGLQWGFAASPIIHDGKVILQVDIHEGPYIAAWDLMTGKHLWRTERPDVAPSWSTPAIWPTPDGEELVVNASVIRGYDPGTGRELWSLGPTSIQVVASPILGDENLFVSSGYPPARPIYAVRPGIRGSHTIESDEDAKPLAWYQTRGGAYMPTPLLYRGLLYVVHHNGRMVAHDATSGARVYQARFSAGGTCTASPVVANGKIYQGTEEGTLYVLEAGPVYRELAVHEFGEPLMATPALSEGLLLVRTPSKLIALRQEPTDSP
jgi:outer membrane protein assembly factor BamB